MVIGYLNSGPTGGRGNAVITALAKMAGGEVRLARDGLDSSTTEALVWGIMMDSVHLGGGHIIKQAIDSDIDYWYIDRAYFKAWETPVKLRITKNSLQLGSIIERPADRFNTLNIDIKPWHTGSTVIVLPPSQHVIKYYGDEAGFWLDKTLEILKQHTDREIVVRNKGGFKDNPRGRAARAADFQLSLINAHAVVGFNTNGLIEAAVAGVPVFATKHSAASPIGLCDFSKIESPLYAENRYEWCNHLAYGQFSRHELKGFYGNIWPILRGL